MTQGLAQEEIDDLLNMQNENKVVNDNDAENQIYDFSDQKRNINNKIDLLSQVNEKFVRNIKVSLFDLVKKTFEVAPLGIKISEFDDYIHSLAPLASIHLITLPPLKGVAFVVLDYKVVFSLVDLYFGGGGKMSEKALAEGQEFTPTEQRVTKLVVDTILQDIKEAWKNTMEMHPQYISMQSNATLGKLYAKKEIMVLSRFQIALNSVGGEIHIGFPGSMTEQMEESEIKIVNTKEKQTDEKWTSKLRDNVIEANIELTCILTQKKIPIRDVARLKKDEIYFIDIPEDVTITMNGINTFKGHFGTHDGKYAVKIKERIQKDKKR